jgi:hypothetical protein
MIVDLDISSVAPDSKYAGGGAVKGLLILKDLVWLTVNTEV